MGGHLIALHRTRVGPFDVQNASAPEDVTESQIMGLAETAGTVMPVMTLTPHEALDISHGRPIRTEGWPQSGPVAAIAEDSGKLIAILESSQGRSRILMGVPDSER